MREGNIGYRGEKVFGGPAFQSKLGNEVATNVGRGAPGAGRQVFKAGSQQGLVTRQNSSKGRDFDV